MRLDWLKTLTATEVSGYSSRLAMAQFRRLTPCVLSLALSCVPFATPFAAEERLLNEGSKAIAAGVPSIAVKKIKLYLAQNPSEERLAQAKLQLAEALVLSNAAEEALEILSAEDFKKQGAAATFWKALALASLRRWADAQPLYKKLVESHGAESSETNPYRDAATFGYAHSLLIAGRGNDALEVFSRLDKNSTFSRYASLFSAKIYLEQGNADAALKTLAPFLSAETSGQTLSSSVEKQSFYLSGLANITNENVALAYEQFSKIIETDEGLNPALKAAAAFAKSEAGQLINKQEQAENDLANYIRSNPDSPYLESAFQRLHNLYITGGQADPVTLRSLLEAESSADPRKPLARYYLAEFYKHKRRSQEAIAEFEQFCRDYPGHSSFYSALLELAKLYLGQKEHEKALATCALAEKAEGLSPGLLAHLCFVAAQASFQLGKFAEAAQLFEQAAATDNLLAQTAIYNQAISWLRDGQEQKFIQNYLDFSSAYPKSELRRELLLEEAFLLAKNGNTKQARHNLKRFIKNFPNHDRVTEAKLALAELYHEQSPQNDAESLRLLGEVQSVLPADGELRERADYLQLWLEDSAEQRQPTAIQERAKAFLREYPNSSLSAFVRFKLGELYYEAKNYPGAQREFELLVQSEPDSSLAEAAYYLAARSATLSPNPQDRDHAMELYQRVVEQKGPMWESARLEQAWLLKEKERGEAAIILYDELAKATKNEEVIIESLLGKAQSLFELGKKDPANYKQCVDVCEQILRHTELRSSWRNLALYIKGSAFQELGQPDSALLTFYDLINRKARPNAEPEFLWYYRAGFEIVKLLEEQNQPGSAAGILKKLIAAGGPRSKEAQERLRLLRLKHFMWDE